MAEAFLATNLPAGQTGTQRTTIAIKKSSRDDLFYPSIICGKNTALQEAFIYLLFFSIFSLARIFMGGLSIMTGVSTVFQKKEKTLFWSIHCLCNKLRLKFCLRNNSLSYIISYLTRRIGCCRII